MALFRNDSPGAITMAQAIEIEKKRVAERKRQRAAEIAAVKAAKAARAAAAAEPAKAAPDDFTFPPGGILGGFNPARAREARELAALGRGGDTLIAHLSRGELVLLRVLQNPAVLAVVARTAAAYRIPLAQLSAGSIMNRINPKSGLPEFTLDDQSENPADQQVADAGAEHQPQYPGTVRYESGIAPAAPALQDMMSCISGKMGAPFTASSTSGGHGPNNPHTLGQAVDGKVAGDASKVLQSGLDCGAVMVQDEYKYPSAQATGGHYHFQTVPGLGGYTGIWVPRQK